MSEEANQVGLAKSAESVEPISPIVHKDPEHPATHVEKYTLPISAPYELYAQLNLDPFKATDTEKQWIGEVYEYAQNQVPEAHRTTGNIMYKIAEMKSRFGVGERSLFKIYEWVKLSKQTAALERKMKMDTEIQELNKRKEALSG